MDLKGEWVSAEKLPGKMRGKKPMDIAVPIGSIRVVEDRAAMQHLTR